MRSKSSRRGDPTKSKIGAVALHQHVVNPVGNDENTDKGNPAKLRVPAGKAKVLHQHVGTPDAPRK